MSTLKLKLKNKSTFGFNGDSVEDVVRALHEWAFFENDFTEIEGCTFQIDGDSRLFNFIGTYFHYCFDHGRINADELLDMVCCKEA